MASRPRTRRSATASVARTLDRFARLVADANVYEAHQVVRSAAARLVKEQRVDDAAALLHDAALALLAGSSDQAVASGVDLALALVDTYTSARVPVDAASLGRLVDLLIPVPPRQPQRKLLVAKSVRWSRLHGHASQGSPQLHHVLGMLAWRHGQLDEAASHFIHGTRDSPHAWADMVVRQVVRAQLEAPATQPSHPAWGTAVARPVLGYLALGDHDAASAFFDVTERALAATPHLLVSSTDAPAPRIIRDPEHALPSEHTDTQHNPHALPVRVWRDPWMNFVRLVLETLRRDARDVLALVKDAHRSELAQHPDLAQLLSKASSVYYGVQPARGGAGGEHPLQAMMAALLGTPGAE